MARPFLKWAGGKAKLAPQILAAMPSSLSAYVEPFAGAAAVFFAVEASRPRIPFVINDANAELIETYTVLRDSHDALCAELQRLSSAYGAAEPSCRRELYYEARSAAPASPVGRAARFIFLNKTCYNGLFRVNASGGFNVPHGRYSNPRIFDADLLGDGSKSLQHADLRSEDFATVCGQAQPGQFVYLDPPYHPLSATANFTGYTRSDFGLAEQRRLRDAFEDLTNRGVAAMLSNSQHPFISDLYGGLGYNLRSVTMSRAINSKGAGRAPIGEFLIDNFERIGLHSLES